MGLRLSFAKGANTLPGNVLDIADWYHFGGSLGVMLLCLIIAALMARVKVGSFPVNPLCWHYWVLTNAHRNPMMWQSGLYSLFCRSYIFFWLASVAALMFAFVVLLIIFNI